MRKLKVFVVSLALAMPMVGTMATPANACMGEVCERVNRVCRKAFHGDCLG